MIVGYLEDEYRESLMYLPKDWKCREMDMGSRDVGVPQGSRYMVGCGCERLEWGSEGLGSFEAWGAPEADPIGSVSVQSVADIGTGADDMSDTGYTDEPEASEGGDKPKSDSAGDEEEDEDPASTRQGSTQ